ncbi:hypothetical protein Tco_0120937 [Tanacetum coccineum]
MGDKNPIRTLRDYSKPSHEGYRNTIELPEGNNVVPLRSDTIRLVQNGCSFHELWFEDPNQHLNDFLKIVDSLDLDGENRERTRLRNAMAHKSIAAFTHDEKEELRKKGIKSPIDSDTREKDTPSTYEHKYELDDMVRKSEGIKEQGKEDDEIETDMEVEEVIEEEVSEFETDEEVKEVFKEEEEDEDDESFNSFPTMKELSHHE